MGDWRTLTNHGLALVCVARQPGLRLREIAECIGVTERAAQRIVGELCEAGYVTRERTGRRNSYKVHPDVALHDPLVEGHRVADLLTGLVEPSPAP